MSRGTRAKQHLPSHQASFLLTSGSSWTNRLESKTSSVRAAVGIWSTTQSAVFLTAKKARTRGRSGFETAIVRYQPAAGMSDSGGSDPRSSIAKLRSCWVVAISTSRLRLQLRAHDLERVTNGGLWWYPGFALAAGTACAFNWRSGSTHNPDLQDSVPTSRVRVVV